MVESELSDGLFTLRIVKISGCFVHFNAQFGLDFILSLTKRSHPHCDLDLL